ncbi:MAG: T9SS type A sorting domain-containing protein [Melioribacteraceae bacterium]
MKIITSLIINLLFLTNSFSQNNRQLDSEEVYDVFPLAKWNQYNYNYQFSDTTLWLFAFESAFSDSGTISYLIIDSTFRDNKIEWLVERNINLLRHYLFSSWSDTTYWIQQNDNFILTESLIGDHELTAGGSVGIWQFPTFLQTPVFRFRAKPSIQVYSFYDDKNFDSLWFNEKKGLYSRRYYSSDVSYHSYFEKTKVDLIGNIVGVFKNFPLSPNNFHLSQNYPNPFNPSTKIKYSIPRQSFVNIKVYDLLGREVTTLVNEEKPSGNYEVEFYVSSLSNGIYFYRLQSGNFFNSKKMILIK